MLMNIKERVVKIFENSLPRVDYRQSNKMVDEGIIDSLSMITLIAELSLEFDVDIEFEQIEPSNFNSLESIVSMIDNLIENR